MTSRSPERKKTKKTKPIPLAGFGTEPGFVSFFSNVPGPCDEVLAQVGYNGVSTHHLGAEDIAEDTVVIVEVDGQQLSLWRRIKKKLSK